MSLRNAEVLADEVPGVSVAEAVLESTRGRLPRKGGLRLVITPESMEALRALLAIGVDQRAGR